QDAFAQLCSPFRFLMPPLWLRQRRKREQERQRRIVLAAKWRRRRDSNPRYGNTPYGGLANRWFQPLTHVSERGSGSAAIVARFQSFNRTGVSAERRRGAWSASSPHPDRAPAFQAPPT